MNDDTALLKFVIKDAWFWMRVRIDGDGCWIWTKGRSGDGYGAVWIPSLRRSVLSHRIAWQSAHGSIPDDLCVLHKCDNPPCCNPDHLFLGTRDDNNKDRARKGRGRNGFLPGEAPFVPGEDHPCAKLTDNEVIAIRSLVAAGSLSIRAVGAIYGVHNSTVSRIANGLRRSQTP